jgi:iron(III) transport system permease protein
MFGPNAGWVNVALRAAFGLDGSGPLNLFSMPGLIVAQGAASVPFVFLLLSATLRSMNPALEEASAASGASPLTTFRRVTLPVLRPGILAPLILSTLVTLEQFELPLIIGLPARISVFSIQIYFELNPDTDIPAYGRAAAVSLPFLAAGLALLLVYNRLVRQSERYVTVTGKGYRPARIALGRWRWPAVAFAGAYVLFAAVLPAAVLMWVSVFGYASPSLAALPNLSFKAYAELFRDPRFHLAVGNTFVAAGVSAFVVTTIGALVAWTVVRTRWRGRFVLDFVSFVSIGIPSVIAGLACLLLYLTVPIGVYGTVWVLVLAYSYRLAVTTRLARAGLMQLHAELEEASYASGGGWLATLRRVVAPLMAPALVSGFLLLFIVGFREFTIGLIMLSDDNIVLSVILWRLFETSRPMHAAAVATLIVLFVVPVIFLARRALLTGREPA